MKVIVHSNVFIAIIFQQNLYYYKNKILFLSPNKRSFIILNFPMAKRRLSYLLSLCLLASGILIIAYLIWSRISLYEIDKRTDFLLVLDIVLLVMLFPLLIYFFLSKQKLAKNNIVLQRLRGKLSHVTENDNIITVQYNVAEQQFIRWNDTTGEPERIFSLDDYWTHIHPDDLPIARKLIEYLHSGNTKEYACEYRYLLPERKLIYGNITIFIPTKRISKEKLLAIFLSVERMINGTKCIIFLNVTAKEYLLFQSQSKSIFCSMM